MSTITGLKSAGALSSLTEQSCVFTKIIFAFDKYFYLRHSETVRWDVSSREVRTSERRPEESGDKEPGRATATAERGSVSWLPSPGVLFPSFPFQSSSTRRRL